MHNQRKTVFNINLIAKIVFLTVLIKTISCDETQPKNEDIWEQDLSDAFQIDASTKGIKKVNLKCGAESMHVQLETEDEFTGVMYTRGSFYKQSEPCFVKPKDGRSTRSLDMRFSFDQCQTIRDGEVFSNVVVVQHDPELVTPGDAAFSLECDFRKPRSLDVGADFQASDRTAYGSRITLSSPDPSASSPKEHKQEDTVYSETNEVTFTPTQGSQNNKINKVEGTVESVPVTDQPKVNEEL